MSEPLSGIGFGIGGITGWISNFVQRQDLFTLIMIMLTVGYVMIIVYLNNKYTKELNKNKPKKQSFFKLKI